MRFRGGLWLVALFLLLLPALVALLQWRSASEPEGTLSDYLVIEQPGEFDAADPAMGDAGIPILCYHYFRDGATPLYVLRVLGAVLLNLPTLDDREYWTNSADEFRRQMQWLADEGYQALTLDELKAVVDGKIETPEKAVAITFDDGDRSVYEIALPILRETGMRGTVFVVSAHVGKKWRNVDSLDWPELAAAQATGHLEVQSHTHDLHYKVKTGRGGMRPIAEHLVPSDGELEAEKLATLKEDLKTSRELLSERLGQPVRHLAWPYGFANARLDSLAQEAGYLASYSLRAGRSEPESERSWELPRFTMTARTTMKLFKAMLGPDLEQHANPH